MDLLNKVMMIGNLTREPELRKTGSGTAVAEICLAINSLGGGRDAETPPDPVFVEVVLWERNAENAAQYLKKGSPVLIEGRLRMDRWEDKDSGQSRSKLRVTGDRMRFLNLAPREDRAPDRRPERASRESQAVGR